MGGAGVAAAIRAVADDAPAPAAAPANDGRGAGVAAAIRAVADDAPEPAAA
jgi:hypothetical protein